MPLQEQYERWKLIIASVRAKRNYICNETSDECTGREMHSSATNSEKSILDHENYFEVRNRHSQCCEAIKRCNLWILPYRKYGIREIKPTTVLSFPGNTKQSA